MNRALLLLAIVSGTASAQIDPDLASRIIDAAVERRGGWAETPVFVGTLLSIRAQECESGSSIDPETDEIVLLVCDGTTYELEYRVDQVLQGAIQAGQTLFLSNHQYQGSPDFAEFQRALIVADEAGYVQYWAHAYATNDGRYAECGCLYGANEGLNCPQITFDPAVTVNLRHSSLFVLDRYETDEAYEVQGDEAICRRGQYVDDFYETFIEQLIESDDIQIQYHCRFTESAACESE